MVAVLPAPDAGWIRRRDEAVLTGVCALLARQLGMPVAIIRAVALVTLLPLLSIVWYVVAEAGFAEGPDRELSILMGLGSAPLLTMTLLWWGLADDAQDSRQAALREDLDAVRGRPDRRPQPAAPAVRLPSGLRWIGQAALVGGTVLGVGEAIALSGPELWLDDYGAYGMDLTMLLHTMAILLALMCAGVTFGLVPLEDLGRDGWRGGMNGPVAALGVGLAMLLLGSLLAAAIMLGPRRALLLIGATALGLALFGLLLVPWGRRLWVSLQEESQERAVIAHHRETTAHLHDSVLQTLAVMQRTTLEADDIRRLARRQERELRRWLYQDTEEDAHTDLRAAVLALTADLEDTHGTDVHTVVVGDAALSDRMRPLLGALREATANACRHGRVGIDVFVDVGPTVVEAYVRDRGPGFDLRTVPEDRLGVRESIIGRMERAGGTAHVRPAPGGGTEVALELPRRSR